jgi:polysaccharide deacetylase 2 family uncharacterized protein YibQ
MGVTASMVDADISEGAETSPEGEPSPPSRKSRSPFLTFGIGLTVELALCTSVLLGSQFLAPPAHRDAGISIKIEPGAIAESRPAPHFSLVEARSPGGHLVADPALVEDSPFGPLPVIGPDGRLPMTAYARPFDTKDKRPKIAIIIGGLNVSANNTKLALARLPPAVTLAFVPFALDAQTAVDHAREAGHEVLLEVPMEPFDFPESDPGPHALMVAASGPENIRRLNWSLSRFTGYVGLTNLLGGRFMSEAANLEPILQEAARRGLLFVDDGASKSSVAPTAARRADVAIATGTLILDDVQSKDAIDKKLGDLEAEARRAGSAIATGSAFPVTVARIAAWAESAEARGFQLVPVSAFAAKHPQQQQQASANAPASPKH